MHMMGECGLRATCIYYDPFIPHGEHYWHYNHQLSSPSTFWKHQQEYYFSMFRRSKLEKDVLSNIDTILLVQAP